MTKEDEKYMAQMRKKSSMQEEIGYIGNVGNGKDNRPSHHFGKAGIVRISMAPTHSEELSRSSLPRKTGEER